MKQLNGLISTLKSKLKRGNGEEEDEEYEEEEEGEDEVGEETEASEVTSKAKKSKAKTKSKSDDEDDDEEDEDEDEEEEDEASDEEAKKKKRVKIMGAVFAVVLLYVVADEMFLNSDVEETAAPEVTGGFKRPPKRDRTKKTPAPNAEATAAVEASATPAVAPTEEALEIPSIEESTPVATAPEVEPTEAVQATDPNVASNPFIDAPAPSENVGEEEVMELTVPNQSESTLPVSEGVDIEEAVAKDIKKEYVAPPKYDQIGRGLVYNCGGKHWACVDKQAYFQCKDNYLHNSSEQKTTECYPAEVYATYDDCKTVQVHHINMVKEIDFCTAN